MFRIQAGDRTSQYCDGLARRSFLQMGVAGMASASLADVWRAQAATTAVKDNAVILLWLDGGPSHMDLYDMKPSAPEEYRGIWKPIPTNVPGVEITELFPKQARIADKFSIVRSLHVDSGDHFTAAHAMLTSRASGVGGASTAGRGPGMGAIVSRLRGANRPGMPAYVATPVASSIGLRPGYFDASYLGSQYRPFETGGDPNAVNFRVENLGVAAGLDVSMLENRRALLQTFDHVRREVDRTGAMDAADRFQQQAYDLVTSPVAQRAFDLSQEHPRLRDAYGRNTWGQSTLLARRLVEAGTTFVTVHMGGWDHHWDLQAGMENYLPRIDALISTLFTDLSQRGLLDRTMVVLCGEFSRTPRMNDGGNGGPPRSKGTPGRDHWGAAMFCLLGGGGVRGGTIVGSTDRLGERPKDRPVTPANIHATIYKVLGIDPSQTFLDFAGRPTAILDEREPIQELIA